VMEIADLVVINKADLDAHAATRAEAQITSALRLFGLHGGHPDPATFETLWQPQVLQMSALKGTGLAEFWGSVERFRTLQTASGRMAARRQRQSEAWMWERIEAGLRARFRGHPRVRGALDPMAREVHEGRLAPSVAARRLLDLMDAPVSGKTD
jgi:LAO/AO transport system kinase